MRICIVYDCLYPYTVGGAERWYRNLAERLVAAGHEVTYLTLRQWERGARLDLDPRVDVRVVGPKLALYAKGRRRILPPVAFGAGVFWHLLLHGRRYDVVHSASFPYFSLLAAGALGPIMRYKLVVDWHEVWSRDYWREYLGPAAGAVGWAIQRACAHFTQRAFCFSQLHAARLRKLGLRGEVRILRGEYSGALTTPEPVEAEPLVLFAGRLIPEKRAPLAVAAVAAAKGRLPQLQALFYGEGPERDAVREAISEHGLEQSAEAPGFAAAEVLERDMRRALCVLAPSRREGYGMVVVEAASCATPSIVVAGDDNAATELIEDGVNGLIVPRPEPEAIADAILRIHEAGLAMRRSTAAWFARNAEQLSLESSLRAVIASYGGVEPAAEGRP